MTCITLELAIILCFYHDVINSYEGIYNFITYNTSPKFYSSSPLLSSKLCWLTISIKGPLSNPAIRSIQYSSTFITKIYFVNLLFIYFFAQLTWFSKWCLLKDDTLDSTNDLNVLYYFFLFTFTILATLDIFCWLIYFFYCHFNFPKILLVTF